MPMTKGEKDVGVGGGGVGGSRLDWRQPCGVLGQIRSLRRIETPRPVVQMAERAKGRASAADANNAPQWRRRVVVEGDGRDGSVVTEQGDGSEV